jgi:putative flippase GtrA
MKRSAILSFGLVGVVGFLVDAGILQLVIRTEHIEVHLARVISFLVASGVTWRLNRRYTFNSSPSGHNQFIEWLRYLWSSAAGALFNYGAFSAVIAFAGDRGLYPLAGVAAGSLAGMSVNWLLYSRYVFRLRVPHRAESQPGTKDQGNSA